MKKIAYILVLAVALFASACHDSEARKQVQLAVESESKSCPKHIPGMPGMTLDKAQFQNDVVTYNITTTNPNLIPALEQIDKNELAKLFAQALAGAADNAEDNDSLRINANEDLELYKKAGVKINIVFTDKNGKTTTVDFDPKKY